jgi:hypothetical protein
MTDATKKDFPFRRILIAAGGTGGHIYPALAVGADLLATDPSLTIRYCCGSRPGEREIYRKAGIDPVVLPMSGRRAGLANQATFVFELASAYRAASRLARDFRSPPAGRAPEPQSTSRTRAWVTPIAFCPAEPRSL